MKKELTILMEEECIECPMLDLETHTLYSDNIAVFKVHNCSHIDFCKAVRKNWERVKNEKHDRKTNEILQGIDGQTRG